jgi:hypothetical protein
MSSFNYTSNTIRKKVVIEALKKLGGSQKRIHNLLCKISGKIKESVIKSSLYSRAKGTFDGIRSKNIPLNLQFPIILLKLETLNIHC